MYRFKWLPEARAVLVRPDGHFDLARSLNTLEALDGAREAGRAQAMIWDVRDRIDYPSASEVRSLVARFDRWDRVAIVVGPDVQYEMARMASLLSDRVVAAKTTAEALAWIRGEALRT